jgi:Tfp pilus assembly protein PilX
MNGNRLLRTTRETGSVLLIALLMMVLLSALGVALLTVASTEHSIASNALWAEGALAAADAGVNRGLNRLSANAQTSLQTLATTSVGTGNTYQYRGGGKTAGAAAPPSFMSSRTESGYSIAVGTGYNPSGYAFHTYQINATGSGPRNALREVEARAEYGPVAQ